MARGRAASPPWCAGVDRSAPLPGTIASRPCLCGAADADWHGRPRRALPRRAGPRRVHSAESLLAAYRGAVERSGEIIERCDDLGRPCARAAGEAGAVRSMRWVLVHMIEETARHAGHADILREQADGSIGR
ncbi:DUF664 domain-containing protein [Streptomyces anulatus]|uniref:mycothiol transferase n=1 Tax=Streptomyces anulatus TaxID=1892 RepID=UPI003985CB2A